MFKKRLISLILGMAITATALTGCSGSDQKSGASNGDVTKIEIAFNQPENHPQYKALEEFGKNLKERTDGKYEVEIFPNELLGAQKETLEMAQSGTLGMTVVACSLLETWNEDFAVFNLPYVFETVEHQKKIINDDEVVGELYDSLKDDGLKVLAGFHGGVRNVYTKEKEVKTPADLKGLKIRVMQSDTNVKMMELMGGTGTAMGQGEVYTAIQTGVLDGGENNELIYSSLKHTEVAPYYTYTKHLMMPDCLVINSDLYDGFPEDVKKIFDEELDKAVETEFDLFESAVTDAKKDAEANGAKFFEIDITPFQEAVKPLTEEKITSDVTKEIYKKIQESAK